MRHPLLPALVLLTAAGCGAKRLPVASTPAPTSRVEAPVLPDDSSNPLVLTAEPLGRGQNADVPQVIRRILREERDLVSRSLALAKNLPDPSGRKRALEEASELSDELSNIAEPLESATSDELDALVHKLLLINTRVALLHEQLRTATNHTTAVAAE